MSLPTLDQLINFFRNQDLPKDPEGEYINTKVENLRVCGKTDTKIDRMYGYTAFPNNLRFLPTDESTTGNTYQDIGSSLLARFFSATDGGEFLHTAQANNGKEFSTPAKMDLCRDSAPSSGVGPNALYPVYLTNKVVPIENDEAILDNPTAPYMVDVEFDFKPEEIIAIVKGVKIDTKHFGVHENDHTRLMINPDMSKVEKITAFVTDAKSPIAAERREAMVKAFNDAVANQKLSADATRANKMNAENAPKAMEDSQDSMMMNLLVSAGIGVGSLAVGVLSTLFLIKMQKKSLNLMEEQIEENRRLMSGEQKLPSPEERERIFETVSRDITKQAQEGKLDPVLGRDVEIKEIVEILNANALTGAQVPALIGERGVGKSAIFEGIAQMVVDGKLPQYKRVVEIDIPGLVAGTGVRGSLETKLGVVKWMIENNPDTLFVMDEVHMIIGAGKTEGSSIDAAQILKSTLARRGSNLIVGTTQAEYRQHIMTDEAFESRMTPVKINPVTGEVRAMIFKGVKEFVIDLSRKMDEDAKEKPRNITIPDATIEYLGSIVGGNNREIKKTLGRIVARARANSAPGANVIITTAQVDSMVKEINVTRKALGQPLLGKTTVITADGFPEDMKLENPPPPPPVGDVIDFMGSGAYEGFKTLTTDQFKTDILKQHPEFAQPENEARLDALAERAFEAYLKLAKNGKSSASDVKAMLDRVVENGKPGSVLTAEDAVPVDVVNKDAVRKQVALRYREFLTQAAREAMSRNEPLPAEPALTQSQYKGKVDAIVNRIVAEYGLKMQNDRAYIDTRWEEQIKRDGFVVAEGVPETFLRDQVEDFIVEDARRTGSPFAKLVDAFRNEGTQKIEVKEYERRMELFREIVKH